MCSTHDLRYEHDLALAIVARISARLDAYHDRDDAYGIVLDLMKLLGLLRVHLAHEDVRLYPRLMESPQADLAELARRYVEDMGDLAQRFEDFVRCWSSSAVIDGAIDRFAADAALIFADLDARIALENAELYPLVDRLDADLLRSAA